MTTETERSLRRWKWTAVIALTSSGCLLAGLVVALAFVLRPARQTDERLIGTWQSDADRTIAEIRKRRPVNDKQEAAFRKLFGKLRVTYGPTTYTTELNGVTESCRYEVLGRDERSVVMRDVNRKPSPLDSVLESSEFAVMQFEGADSYWLYAPLIDVREYFKRVR